MPKIVSISFSHSLVGLDIENNVYTQATSRLWFIIQPRVK